MRRRQIFKIQTFKRLEKPTNRLDEPLEFMLSHSLNFMGERGAAWYCIRWMHNNPFNVHSAVMLIKPSAGAIHLLGLALVDFSALDVDLTLTLK
jgi:hypothetical protein